MLGRGLSSTPSGGKPPFQASRRASLRWRCVRGGGTVLLCGEEVRGVHCGRVQRPVVGIELLVRTRRIWYDRVRDRVPAGDVDTVGGRGEHGVAEAGADVLP